MAIGRLPFVFPELETRKLIAATKPVIEIETGYWLVSPLGQETRSAVKAFRKWLMEEAKAYNAATSKGTFLISD
jgi:hypothetical protein